MCGAPAHDYHGIGLRCLPSFIVMPDITLDVESA